MKKEDEHVCDTNGLTESWQLTFKREPLVLDWPEINKEPKS